MVSTKVCILDFSVTPGGMEETLLNIVLLHEHPTLETERIEVQVQVVENQEQLRETEAYILKVMSESMGNILDDEETIAVLRESQTIAKTVAAKQELAKSLEYKHELLRVGYVPAARHGRVLYFVLSDMDWINSMYRFSISWFSNTFRAAVKGCRKEEGCR